MIRMSSFWWVLLAGAIFGLIHSIFASNRVKDLAARWLGEKSRKYYRLFFSTMAGVSSLIFLGVVFLLPDELIYLIPAPWVYLTLIIQLAAFLGAARALAQINTADFLGFATLRKRGLSQSSDQPPVLVTRGLYGLVRHPIYTCSFVFLIFFPWMSWNLLGFIIAVIVYTIIGAFLEERKMVQIYGEEYIRYQKQVPMFLLLPFTKGRS